MYRSGARPRACLLVLPLAVAALFALALAQNAAADTVISTNTTYTTNTTWSVFGSPYVLNGDVTVALGATLTIEPGVIVKLAPQKSIRVDGTLSAVGQAFAPILFTSTLDTGGVEVPDAQKWYEIRVQSAVSTTAFSWVTIRNGGWGSAGTAYGALHVRNNSTVTVDYSQLVDNQRSGLKIGPGSRAVVRNTTISRNEMGVSALDGSLDLDVDSTVSENTSDGLNLMYSLSYAGVASRVYDSDVKQNGRYGVYLYTDRNMPVAKWPHGSGSNIYGNTQGQLYLNGYHPTGEHPRYDVDWTGNFWGTDVYFRYNDARCLTTGIGSRGKLAYTWDPGSQYTPPKGPLPANAYIAGSGNDVSICAYDRFKVEPWQFSRTPVDIQGSGVLVGWSGDESKLDVHSPIMIYDAQESYYADSAATITDNHTEEYTNVLQDANDNVIAASDPGHEADWLRLDYLGGSYPGGAPAAGNHQIDEANSRAEDVQRMHANPGYADKTYGRVVAYANGDLVLQYWFFYYHNPRQYVWMGDHEGDWEMIQVRLDRNLQPVDAMYSQHNDGEECSWAELPKVGDHPVVYVGDGSHASFTYAGQHPVGYGAEDDADGNGNVASLSVVRLSTGPSWLSWPGQWGGADSSPNGPAFGHGTQWSDPLAWQASDGGDCEAGSGFRLRRPRPANPEVSGRRVGDRVVVDYRFDSPPASADLEPWQIATTVDARGDRYTPLTVRNRVTDRSGTIVQPLGLARGKLELLVSVRAQNGARSRTIRVPIK